MIRYRKRSWQYKKIYKKLKRLAEHCYRPDKKSVFATGVILGYKFRLFQDVDGCAYVLIADQTKKGHYWPAFYTPDDLQQWYDDNKTNKQ